MKNSKLMPNLFYSLVSVLMLISFISQSLNAQLIVQRDVDTSIVSYLINGNVATYNLDIDEDEITNIVFSTRFNTCTGGFGPGTSLYLSIDCDDDVDYTEYLYEDYNVRKMNFDESIEPTTSSMGFDTDHGYFAVSDNCYQYGNGNWFDGQGYLGFRFGSDESFYYGWVFLTINTSSDETEIVIHSYAYCTIPNQVISAGQTELSISTDAITNLQIADIADNGDGRDLEVSYNKISNESTLLEYRVMVVKAADSYAFNLEKADTVTNYLSVSPTGNNIIAILNQNSKDVNGDIVRTNLSYRIYVLSVANGTQANINALSERSDMITLIGGSFVDDYNSHILNCYPNPSSSFVNFNSEHVFDLVEVYDVTGSLLSVQSVNDTHGTIDMSAYNEGSYYLIFKSDSQSVVKSLLKIDK